MSGLYFPIYLSKRTLSNALAPIAEIIVTSYYNILEGLFYYLEFEPYLGTYIFDSFSNLPNFGKVVVYK